MTHETESQFHSLLHHHHRNTLPTGRKRTSSYHGNRLGERNFLVIWLRRYGFKRILMLVTLLAGLSIITLSILCPEIVCSPKQSSSSTRYDELKNSLQFSERPDSMDNDDDIAERLNVDRILLSKFGYDYHDYIHYKMSKIHTVNFDHILETNRTFQINSTDTMVFLHMQKTGGSAFDRHLIRDLILPQPCKCDSKRKKKCRCFRPGTSNKYWLFSRHSIGWKCGLHADYTELTNCVDRILDQVKSMDKKKLVPDEEKSMLLRNYFFVTLVRDPIARFLSEFKHVQRGATWKTSRHWCDGRLPTPKEVPLCFHGSNWRNVSFDEFISCPHNLAFNRQTRMLADLSLVGCYNRSVMTEAERDAVMLFSAKRNLEQMAMFGLCEEQLASQYMFERIFSLRFKRPFVQFNQTRSHEAYAQLSYGSVEKIRQLNHLDMALYSFARRLFRQRFARVRESDPEFETYYQQLISSSHMQLIKNKISRAKKILHTSQTPAVSSAIVPQRYKESLIDEAEYYDSSSPNTDSIDEMDSVEDYYV